MKTLNGDSASQNGSIANREDGGKVPAGGKTLDFSQAELPFTNFASVQEVREKDRMSVAVADPTVTTIASDTRPGAPSISDYYSLAKKQGQR